MLSTASDGALTKCSLFRGMSATERQELLSMLEARSYKPGDTILAEGESLQHVWIVLKGKCRVVKKGASGEEKELSVIEPSGVFGEMSFFNPAPHSASVRALSEVEAVRLAREKYESLLREGSLAAYKLAYNTMGVLIERLRRMDDWIAQRMERNNTPHHHEEWMDFQSKLYTGWTF
jgi:CRP-like cAMP-binding protein